MTKLSDFRDDDRWQRAVRDRILVPYFYVPYSKDGRFVLFDSGSNFTVRLQREFHIDSAVQRGDGRVMFIDDKIVRWPESGEAHAAYCFETCSCTKAGRERLGWGFEISADYLLYCFEQADRETFDCHLLDVERLKEFIFERLESLPTFGPLKSINGTQGKLVPFDAAERHDVLVMRKRLTEAVKPDSEPESNALDNAEKVNRPMEKMETNATN